MENIDNRHESHRHNTENAIALQQGYSSISDRLGSYASHAVEFFSNLDLKRKLIAPALAVVALGGIASQEVDTASAKGLNTATISTFEESNLGSNSVTTTTFETSKNTSTVSVNTSVRKKRRSSDNFNALVASNPADPLSPKELHYPSGPNNYLDVTIRVPFNFEFGKPTPATYIVKYDASQKWKPNGVKLKKAKTHKQIFGRKSAEVYDVNTSEKYSLTNFKDNLYYETITGKPRQDVNKLPKFTIKPNKTKTKVIMTTFEQCNGWDFRGPSADADKAKYISAGFSSVPPKDFPCLPVEMGLQYHTKISVTKKSGGKKLRYQSESDNLISVENVKVANPSEVFNLPSDPEPTSPTGPTGPTM